MRWLEDSLPRNTLDNRFLDCVAGFTSSSPVSKFLDLFDRLLQILSQQLEVDRFSRQQLTFLS